MRALFTRSIILLLLWLGIAPDRTVAAISDGIRDVEPQLGEDQVQHDFQAGITSADMSNIGVTGGEPDTQRHREEKEQLLKRLNKSHGTYNVHHPRWRLLKTIYSFRRYRDTHKAEVKRWRNLHKQVSNKQRATLEKAVRYGDKLNDLEHLIDRNGLLCDGIAETAMGFYGIGEDELDSFIREEEVAGRGSDRVSVTQALKHYVRDWASEGANERDAAFPCILETLSNIFPERSSNNATAFEIKALLPGAGLGRLGYEVASLGGFEVTINEWSTYMVAAYRHLEHSTVPGSIQLHPFIDGLSHHATNADLMRAVALPSPPAPHDPSSVLLVEGDFTTVFGDASHVAHYDVLVTHFFIDTARNLMSYLETIHQLLRPGGRWLNFGPLLYGTAPFVQLSLDEVVLVAEEMGFEFGDLGDACGLLTFPGGEGGLGKVRGKDAAYGFDERELRRNAYIAQSWVAVKVT
ncbi:hypothetical protein AAE478_003224 [Parahypoxylon ruwenzoriense]